MSLFTHLGRLIGTEKERSPEEEAEEDLLAHVIEMTDRRLAGLASCREELMPAIQLARLYYSEVLGSIPGPFELDSKQPPLPEIFPQQEDLMVCLGRSLAVKNELSHHIKRGRDRVYALLGVRRKTTPDGKYLLVDHTVRSLRRSAGAVRRALRDAAFDSLLQGFANQHLHYEKKLEQVRSQQELLQEARIASTHAAQAVSSLASVQQVASNPEKVLASLVDCLFAPRERLYMHYEEGYPLHMGNDKENNLLPMMITYDRRHWLVCIVGFPIAMAQEALEKEAHNHRFILI